MTVMDPNRLVDDYIESLARAARSLPAGRREELLADVRSHVAESGATTEAEVRNVLERLGSAEEILAEYEDVPGTPPRVEPRLRIQEYAALVLLPRLGASCSSSGGSSVWCCSGRRTGGARARSCSAPSFRRSATWH